MTTSDRPAGEEPPATSVEPAGAMGSAPPASAPERERAPRADGSPEAGATSFVDPLRGSRTSGLWAAIIGLGLVLILLIIFIAQNTQPVAVSFLGWTGEPPLAVALLAAAVGALLLTASAGTLRIWQLRRRVKKETKLEARG